MVCPWRYVLMGRRFFVFACAWAGAGWCVHEKVGGTVMKTCGLCRQKTGQVCQHPLGIKWQREDESVEAKRGKEIKGPRCLAF